MKKRKTVWRLVAKALGEKAGKNNKEADQIAFIRLVITLQILITNFFIIGGVIRHWNDSHEIPSHLPQTQKESSFKTSSNVL